MPIVDLDEVKAHLNIAPTDISSDVELGGFIASAEDLARDVVGPVMPEPHTDWCDGGTVALTLDWLPLAAVTSVVEYVGPTAFPLTEQPLGASVDAYAYTVDLDHGQIIRREAGSAVPFAPGTRNVMVAYTSGTGVVPATVRLGTLELIRHLWQMTQQGGLQRVGMAPADETRIPAGFALPTRVLELWQPYRRPPGIA